MALSSCLFSSPGSVSFKMDCPRLSSGTPFNCQISMFAPKSKKAQLFGHSESVSWKFLGGSTAISRPNLGRNSVSRKGSAVYASWMSSSQIASSAFTWGTVTVLPFYTFMVVAPQAELTKKVAASSIPYIFLGILYAYMLYLSWTPDTIRLMFASKYWLPELPGIAMMFSNEMTLASAWIHLLAADLFAARQVYFDGVQENLETRHSVTLCLMFCPIGILSHIITKAVATGRDKTEHGIH